MAKGQMRSNKEVRKPKADKKAPKADAPAAAAQPKFAKSEGEKKKK